MTSLSMEQMYRVLRGLPGTMQLTSQTGEEYILTVVNPNAPANRCQETLGLSISLDGPIQSAIRKIVSRLLTESELETLRSGTPLALDFGNVAVDLQSNPGGHLVSLEQDPGTDGQESEITTSAKAAANSNGR
jgi:hypothetical protein